MKYILLLSLLWIGNVKGQMIQFFSEETDYIDYKSPSDTFYREVPRLIQIKGDTLFITSKPYGERVEFQVWKLSAPTDFEDDDSTYSYLGVPIAGVEDITVATFRLKRKRPYYLERRHMDIEVYKEQNSAMPIRPTENSIWKSGNTLFFNPYADTLELLPVKMMFLKIAGQLYQVERDGKWMRVVQREGERINMVQIVSDTALKRNPFCCLWQGHPDYFPESPTP